MPKSNPPPPNILSYDDLREAAAAFSRRHWPQGTIPVDWYTFQDNIPEEDRRWYEWQANSFAGLVLVPPDALSTKVGEAVALLRGSGVADPDLEEEATRSYLAEWVGRRFEVSADVILRRGKYDGHWSEF